MVIKHKVNQIKTNYKKFLLYLALNYDDHLGNDSLGTPLLVVVDELNEAMSGKLQFPLVGLSTLAPFPFLDDPVGSLERNGWEPTNQKQFTTFTLHL